jgi:hypothetical protein
MGFFGLFQNVILGDVMIFCVCLKGGGGGITEKEREREGARERKRDIGRRDFALCVRVYAWWR